MFEILAISSPPPPSFYFQKEVPSFITGSALASAIGLSTGVLINDNTPWLEFLYKGKTLFVPKLPIRNSISWGSVYQRGAVYGTDTDTDPVYNPALTRVVQNARVTVGGDQYRVRLFNGSSTNPYQGEATWDPKLMGPSEWNDLWFQIVDDPVTRKLVGYNGPLIENPYTPADVGFGDHPSTGQYTLVKEVAKAVSGISRIVNRGYRTSCAAFSVANAGQALDYVGWRPVLEKI